MNHEENTMTRSRTFKSFKQQDLCDETNIFNARKFYVRTEHVQTYQQQPHFYNNKFNQ